MSLEIQPCTLREATRFVLDHHRHHRPPQGGLFAIALSTSELGVRGVVIIGRPVARMNDDGFTAEVTRCCTLGDKNACSMLYGAAWRAARALGYRRLITYTLATEPGTSLVASGFTRAEAPVGARDFLEIRGWRISPYADSLSVWRRDSLSAPTPRSKTCCTRSRN